MTINRENFSWLMCARCYCAVNDRGLCAVHRTATNGRGGYFQAWRYGNRFEEILAETPPPSTTDVSLLEILSLPPSAIDPRLTNLLRTNAEAAIARLRADEIYPATIEASRRLAAWRKLTSSSTRGRPRNSLARRQTMALRRGAGNIEFMHFFIAAILVLAGVVTVALVIHPLLRISN